VPKNRAPRLVLENPGFPASRAMTPNLYAGLQLILPGEIATVTGTTQSALRFIVEARAPGRPSTASAKQCTRVISSLRRHGHGMTTGIPP